MSDPEFLLITKLDAARRQLRTAIELWFNDGDPVSIHALAYASYEIIHTLSRRKGVSNLLYDSSYIKEESREKLNIALKQAAGFFKHAQKDPDKEIEFSPAISEGFIIFSLIALQASGESLGDEEFAFMTWDGICHPESLTDEGRKSLIHRIPIDEFRNIFGAGKREFFKRFIKARRSARATGAIR